MAGGMDIATIGLKVDSNGVVVATENLEGFVDAGKSAEQQADKLGKQAKQTSEQVKAAGTAAGQTAQQTDKLASAQGKASQAANQHGLSVKQQAAAMRLLPAQITDIVTSLVSGQPAYLVAIQQGGQLKDSFGGIAPAARALLTVFTPLNLLLGAVAGGAAAAFLSFQKGQQESEELVRSLILTGNAAGVTAGQLGLIAQSLDNVEGTRSKAAEVLALLVSTGRVGSENLERLAQATIAAERTLGLSADSIARNFSELGKAPLDASIKLNESLNYLNARTIEQIANLEKAGRSTDAARIAQDAYANALQSRSGEMDENLGNIERFWRGIKSAIAEATDAALSFGRVSTDEQRLKQLTTARGDRPLGGGYTLGGLDARRRDDEEELYLRDRVAFLKAGADAQAEVVRRTREGNEARERNKSLVESTLSSQEKLNAAIEQYKRDQELIARGGFTPDSPEQQAKVLQSLRKQYAEPQKKGDAKGAPDETFLRNLKSDSAEIALFGVPDKTFVDNIKADSAEITQNLKEQYDAATAAGKAFEENAEKMRKMNVTSKDVLDSYIDSISNVSANLTGGLLNAYDQAIARASDLAAANLLWGEGGSEAAKALARDIITSVVSAFIQAGAQAAALYALQQAGIIATTTASVAGTQTAAAASVVASGEVATAAAPAAAATSLATAGANAPLAIAGIALVAAAIGAILGGAFEKGGRPPVGKVSLIGEGGPELWVPDSAGTIIPNGGWSGMTSPQSSVGSSVSVVNRAPGVNLSWMDGIMYVDMQEDLLQVAVGRSRVDRIKDARYNGPATREANAAAGIRRKPRFVAKR